MESIIYSETKYQLTVKEAAHLLGVSIHTVYRLIDEGKLKAFRPSAKTTRISVGELKRYMEK